MSFITFEWYNNFGKTSFLIKMILPQHFALEVWVSIWFHTIQYHSISYLLPYSSQEF